MIIFMTYRSPYTHIVCQIFGQYRRNRIFRRLRKYFVSCAFIIFIRYICLSCQGAWKTTRMRMRMILSLVMWSTWSWTRISSLETSQVPAELWIRIQIGSVFSNLLDPDPYSEYGSGSTPVKVG